MLTHIVHTCGIGEIIDIDEPPDSCEFIPPWEENEVVTANSHHYVSRHGKFIEVERVNHELGFTMYRVVPG